MPYYALLALSEMLVGGSMVQMMGDLRPWMGMFEKFSKYVSSTKKGGGRGLEVELLFP